MNFIIDNNELEFLKKQDKKLAPFIEKYGNLSFVNNNSLYEDINKNIISQMLTIKAANTIFNKFINIIGSCTPENVLNSPDELLRKCGISYSKINYIKGIAENILNSKLCLENLENYNEIEIINILTKQKGIGIWTAEMIALFSLGKKNIFSYSDIALKQGIKVVHNEINIENKEEFNKLKELYSPYCSIASLYYYHIHDYE